MQVLRQLFLFFIVQRFLPKCFRLENACTQTGNKNSQVTSGMPSYVFVETHLRTQNMMLMIHNIAEGCPLSAA